MHVRYITKKEYKQELEKQLASHRNLLEVVPSEFHRLEVLKLIDNTEKELEELN
jgi:hypothetical protein